MSVGTTSPFDFNNTWDIPDKSEEERSRTIYSSPSNYYDKGESAKMDAILSAFSQSNAMQTLREDSRAPSIPKSQFVRMQNKHEEQRAMNQNILPETLRHESMFLDTFFGNLGVETNVENGTWTDRLGTTYKIMESQIPPANKDYRNASSESSDRRLETMGVFVTEEKKKSEVQGTINPAEELVSSKQVVVRSNELELNNREMFFNQNGVQESPEFEQSRDMYDGYNWKTGHETRTFPLEQSWREDLTKPVAVRKMSSAPDKRVTDGLTSKKREISSTYRVEKANPTTPIQVSAKHTHLSLPVLNEATIRCDAMPMTYAPHIDKGANLEKYSKHDNTIIEHGRLEESLEIKPSHENVTVASMKSSLDHLNLLRENGAVTPKATREWAAIRKIAEGIDHIEGDDTEIADILDRDGFETSKHIHESIDHQNMNELPSQYPRALDAQIISSSHVASGIHENETREMIMHEVSADNPIAVSARKSEIILNGSDSKTVETKNNGLYSVPDTSIYSTQQINDNNRQIEAQNLAQPIIVSLDPVFSSISIEDKNRQQEGNIVESNELLNSTQIHAKAVINENNRQQESHEGQASLVIESDMRDNILIQDTRRQLKAESPRNDIMYFEPIESHITIEDNNRENKAKEALQSVVYPTNAMDSHIDLPLKNRQQVTKTSLKSSHVENQVLDATIQIKDERKSSEARMVNTNINDTHVTTTKYSLPMTERAQYTINRPGYMNGQSIIHTETTLPDNNRNNISARKTSIQSDTAPQINGKTKEILKVQHAPFAYIAQGESSEHTGYVHENVRVKDTQEAHTFARVNSMHSSQSGIRNEVEAPTASSGQSSIDRLHAPYNQNWKRNEARIQQSSESKDERATPCRSPSRNVGNEIRMTPTLKSDSRREMCERPVSSQNHRSTPLLVGTISRNENC